KPKEDKFDEAARKNDDTPSNSKDKPAAEKAQQGAEKAANDINAAFGNPARAANYRDALKKRRDARAKLKDICSLLTNMLQVRRQSPRNDNSDIEAMLKKCREALVGTNQVITVAYNPYDKPATSCGMAADLKEFAAMGCSAATPGVVTPTTSATIPT